MEKQINIGGQKRPVAFNYAAIRTYEFETGESYLAILESLAVGMPKLTNVIALAYAGLIGAKQKVEIDQVAEWVMRMEQGDLEMLFKAFYESLPQRKADNPDSDRDPAQEGAPDTGE